MRLFILLAAMALMLSACLQTAPAATPSPTATLQATLAPTATVLPTSTPSALPSPVPAASPSITPVISASVIPTLAEAAVRLEPVFNSIFNATRLSRGKNTTFSLIDQNVWSMDAVEADYTYAVTFYNAHTRWLPEDYLDTAQNASGTKNGYISYAVGESDKPTIMKCYGQRYEMNMNLKGYSRTWSADDYQPTVRRIMGRLIDACPP